MQCLRLFLSFTAICTAVFIQGCGNKDPQAVWPETDRAANSTATVNINTASEDELRRLPHVGESLAAAIIEHRNAHGHFRKPEHLMLVKGVSDARFRRIRHLIRTD